MLGLLAMIFYNPSIDETRDLQYCMLRHCHNDKLLEACLGLLSILSTISSRTGTAPIPVCFIVLYGTVGLVHHASEDERYSTRTTA